MTDTRQRFIDAAVRSFAERGFYGASLATIAEDLSLTKQALLHHFGTKEKLYGEVLAQISERLTGDLNQVQRRNSAARQRLEETFDQILRTTLARPHDTQVLMRELLDNRRRADTSRKWFLKPFLDTLTALVLEAYDGRIDRHDDAFAISYQLLGAVSYYAISGPTLRSMYGKTAFERQRRAFRRELRVLIAARLAVTPGA